MTFITLLTKFTTTIKNKIENWKMSFLDYCISWIFAIYIWYIRAVWNLRLMAPTKNPIHPYKIMHAIARSPNNSTSDVTTHVLAYYSDPMAVYSSEELAAFLSSHNIKAKSISLVLGRAFYCDRVAREKWNITMAEFSLSPDRSILPLEFFSGDKKHYEL